MIIRNVTRAELEAAAAAVRALYGTGPGGAGGVCLAEAEAKTRDAKAGGRGTFRVRLGVESSKGPGARRSASGRRLKSACWHAHGHFFDSLPRGAVIGTGALVGAGGGAVEAGAAWVDRQIGPMMNPVMFLEVCDCGGTSLARRQLGPVTVSGPAWVSAQVAKADVPKVPKVSKKAARFDLVGSIMAYESGTASDSEVLALFSHLVKTGQAWTLQGSYGRAAARLIEGGVLSKTGDILQEVG